MADRQTKCPICGTNAGFRHYLNWDGNQWFRYIFCGGGHKEPYIPEVEDEDLTDENYDTPYFESAFHERRWQFAANQARWLHEHYRDGMGVLEIGPGLGLAAERFLKSAPANTMYHVVEPHSTFSAYISERQAGRVVVHSGDPVPALEEALAATCGDGRPVLFYMDNVLEHLAYPRDYFMRLRSALPSGSVALLDVPNERGLKSRCKVYRAIGAQPTAASAHINLFTNKAFHAMFGGLGLRHRVRQRGIRHPEEVNCIPEGPALTAVLAFLRVVPVDTMLGLGNNLRVEAVF